MRDPMTALEALVDRPFVALESSAEQALRDFGFTFARAWAVGREAVAVAENLREGAFEQAGAASNGIGAFIEQRISDGARAAADLLSARTPLEALNAQAGIAMRSVQAGTAAGKLVADLSFTAGRQWVEPFTPFSMDVMAGLAEASDPLPAGASDRSPEPAAETE